MDLSSALSALDQHSMLRAVLKGKLQIRRKQVLLIVPRVSTIHINNLFTVVVGGAASSAVNVVVEKSTKVAKSMGIFDRLKSASDATSAKLHEVNEKYKITEQMKAASEKTVAKIKEIDTKYEISSSAARMVSGGSRAAPSADAVDGAPAAVPNSGSSSAPGAAGSL